MEPFLETWEYESFYYRTAFRTCWLERMCRHSVLPSIAHYLFVEDDYSEKRDKMPTTIYCSNPIIPKPLFEGGSHHTELVSKRFLEMSPVEEDGI